MACHTPPLKKVKKQGGNAITQPWYHPIKKNVEFRDGMGWDRGWVMVFPLISSLF